MSKKIEDLLKMTDEDLFGYYNEDDPGQASQNVKATYRLMNEAEENYIAAIAEDSFSKGFRYAVKLMKGGAV